MNCTFLDSVTLVLAAATSRTATDRNGFRERLCHYAAKSTTGLLSSRHHVTLIGKLTGPLTARTLPSSLVRRVNPIWWKMVGCFFCQAETSFSFPLCLAVHAGFIFLGPRWQECLFLARIQVFSLLVLSLLGPLRKHVIVPCFQPRELRGKSKLNLTVGPRTSGKSSYLLVSFLAVRRQGLRGKSFASYLIFTFGIFADNRPCLS